MIRKILQWRISCHLFVLVAAIALAHLVFFQEPLLSFALTVSDASLTGFVQLLSLQLLQFGLLTSLLLAIAIFSITAMKILSTILFLTNATALYFMQTYGIEFDITMISNVFGTDTREATELWHISIVGYVLAFGLLPSYLVWICKVARPRWFLRFLAPFAVLAVLLAFLFATSFTWLWYDQHATRMGSRILPWSYIVNTGRFYNQKSLRERDQILLPQAQFAGAEPEQKEIVVLVIGEAARAKSLGQYGYERETNPFTKETTLFALPSGLACSTYTIGSTACINTHVGSAASARTVDETLASYMTRHGVHTIWRSNNSGVPPYDVTLDQRARDIAATCEGDDCPDGNLDEALNWGLADLLQQTDAKRIFVVLHQSGSHGPSYYKKVPPEFQHFTPVCETVQVSKCSSEELYNAYDNTVRYTDSLLADLIKQLDSLPDANAVMMYVSDHGQALGEGGFFLHGTPSAVAPDEMRRVPFLVWMSEGFQKSRGLSQSDVMRDETFPHDFPFHSVMGAFGMRSDIYKPEFDIFSKR